MTMLKIRYVKSMIGYNQRQRETIRSLGFTRLNGVVEKEDSPSLRGMLHAVRHLVKVEEQAQATPNEVQG
jgi:large subunit ribosomal protein L30